MTDSTGYDYYYYLLDRAGVTDDDAENYSYLFTELYNREFVWIIEKDENRALDGMNLRDQYTDDTGGFVDPDMYCSMLEMMVALAIRCENDIMGEPDEDRTNEWFWSMLTNLGLHRFDNKNWDRKKVNKLLDRLISRQYDASGNGGLFPLTNPMSDQRDVEIWYQMSSWLNERYE